MLPPWQEEQEEQEEAGYFALTVRKQRGATASAQLAVPFLLSLVTSSWNSTRYILPDPPTV